tara:strand:- start:759 stop:1922 length:1164 start_codon:yes stop_codon:yes gene_type:complete
MTLIKSLKRHFLFAIAAFFLLGGFVYAKKYKLEGQVLDPSQEGVKGAKIAFLLDGEVEEEIETGRKGKFKEKLEEGVYTVRATMNNLVAEQEVDLSDNTEIELVLAEPKKPEPEEQVKRESISENMASQLSVSVPQTPSSVGGPSKDFILNELNFEIKKLSAEFKHISQEIDDLKALSKMWVNPLTIYSKEIILKNGSTVFGKIIYQDDKSLKVETLVGYLIVDRAQVVRIVDNVITEDTQEYVPEQIRDSYSPPPMPKLAQPKYTSANNSSLRNASAKFSANCVLVGNISEKKDGQGNIIFNGEIKNIGGRRADFVKVDFVFRKNWSGETKTLTTFVKGSYNTFDTGIVSDASLLPGAIGKFDLYVPNDFGAFIGYSYVIDWEEYQ